MMLDIKIHANFGHVTIGIYVIYRRYMLFIDDILT